MSLSIAMRRTLGMVYERLQTDQAKLTASGIFGSARTLDALQMRELLTWGLNDDLWQRDITLTAAGLAECARYYRYCLRCGSRFRTERDPVTVGYEAPGTRNIGEAIKGPCPCRWHDDEELAR